MASSADEAELASVTGTLEDLHRRVGAMAQRHDREPSPRDDVVAALFEAERALAVAVRTAETARRTVASSRD